MNSLTQRTLAISLALVAGYVDGCGLRAFGTYVSFMSGNTTQTGLLLGQGHVRAALPSAVAIVSFVGGSFAGTWLMHSVTRRPLSLLFITVAALLASAGAVMHSGSAHSRLMIALLACAMGMMNTTLAHVGSETVSLTFVTGNLSRVGSHLALALKRPPALGGDISNSHLRRALDPAGVWAAFLGGAVLSGTVLTYLGTWMLLPPLIVLLTLSFVMRST
jgi:uncharacterized membrane protein YoaK (UPF0700 family)